MYLLEEDLKFPKDSFKSMKYQPYEMKPSFSMKEYISGGIIGTDRFTYRSAVGWIAQSWRTLCARRIESIN